MILVNQVANSFLVNLTRHSFTCIEIERFHGMEWNGMELEHLIVLYFIFPPEFVHQSYMDHSGEFLTPSELLNFNFNRA